MPKGLEVDPSSLGRIGGRRLPADTGGRALDAAASDGELAPQTNRPASASRFGAGWHRGIPSLVTDRTRLAA